MRKNIYSNFIEYFGWISFNSLTIEEKESLTKKLNSIQGSYPFYLNDVNGNVHLSFSGFPNHYHEQADEIMEYLASNFNEAYGQVTIIDHDDVSTPYILKLISGEIVESRSKDINLEDVKKINS
jgi:hypothetical protein